MDKIKKLDCLEDFLSYWEDLNLLGNFNFQTSLRMPHLAPNAPQIGSELTNMWGLGREIQKYTHLRKFLSEKQTFNPAQFLPRIPLSYRDKSNNPIDFLYLVRAEAPLFAPLFLERWMQTKKVCEVTQNEKIELIDPAIENYLPNLPYSSFMLMLREPLHIPFLSLETFRNKHALAEAEKTAKVHGYKDFIIFRDEDTRILYAMAIPEKIHSFLVSKEFKACIATGLEMLKTKKTKETGTFFSKQLVPHMQEWMSKLDHFLIFKFDLDTGESWEPEPGEGKTKSLVWNKIKCTEKIKSLFIKDGDDPAFLNTILDASDCKPMFFLNGIGKLFKNYTAPEDITVRTFTSDEQPQEQPKKVAKKTVVETVKEEPVLWNEVAIGNMMFVQFAKKHISGVSIRTGTEKNFHIRRKHPRKYINKVTGELIKEIEIGETRIRPDKEHLKGSTGKIN